MKLAIVRHCKAYEAHEDPERKLTEEGQNEAIIIAQHLKKTGWKFKEILTSPVLRALETGKIINQYLQIPLKQKQELKPHNALEEFHNLLSEYDMNEALILVFHMPDVAEIVARILKIPTQSLYVSPGAVFGIKILNKQKFDGILTFLYQPEFLLE